jgi:predicted nucleic acid-binding protein
MRLFLDASVMLAASGSSTGASRALFDHAAARGWSLLASHYALSEVARNIPKLPPAAAMEWQRLRPAITLVGDVVSLDRPVVFPAGKDRPILFSALAFADVLLTLDRADFGGLLGGTFYGLTILRPSDFLMNERAAGRL